jgi:hypothetical protein
MKISTLIFACVLLTTGWSGHRQNLGKASAVRIDHAIYLGVIQIIHEADGATAEVNVKVFSNDTQNALRNAFEDYEVIPAEEICARQKDLLVDYFAKHLICTINGAKATMDFKTCQKENDVYWLTFNMGCPAKWKELRIEADFFMELFPTQSNMVSLHHGEERRFLRLTKGQSEQELVF